MLDILMRACCFIAVIVLGNVLKRAGFFKESDFGILSKIVIKITLPATIVYSFSGKEIDPGLLLIVLLGLGGNLIYVGLAWLVHRKDTRENQAFAMLNTAGYNIGTFTLPFVQSFLGPMGVITTSLFDTGNAFLSLGGAYSLASIVKDNSGFSAKRILKSLIRSVPFDCYIIMITLNLCHITLPTPVLSFAQIIANANAFLAMLMIGVGFKLNGDRTKLGRIVKVLAVRFGFAVLFAAGCFYLLPFSMEVRRALMILVFSPVASAAPVFTGEMKSDVGLASAINSISIVIGIVCIVSIVLLTA